MIVKSTSIKSKAGIARVIRYVFRDDKRAELIHSRYIPLNPSEEQIIALFEKQEAKRKNRRKNNIVIYHDILSFHASDSHKLMPENLREIAKRYSEMREYALSVSIAHTDTDHVHIHHLSSGYGINHVATRVSRQVFKQKKLELETYSRKRMRLVHSNVNHQKELNLKLSRIQQEIHRNGRLSEKERLGQTIQKIARGCHSLQEFINALKQQNIKHYFRGGKLYGIWNEKHTKKYRFSGLGIDPYTLNPKQSKKLDRTERLKRNRKR